MFLLKLPFLCLTTNITAMLYASATLLFFLIFIDVGGLLMHISTYFPLKINYNQKYVNSLSSECLLFYGRWSLPVTI